MHHRYSIRLKNYDYTQTGGYFITICTQYRECLFGDITNGKMILNECGKIVRNEWLKTAKIRREIKLDAYVVMPDHFHGILIINNCCTGTARRIHNGDGSTRGTARRAPTMEQFGRPVPGSIPTMVRSFKSAVTKRINELRNTPGAKCWQRNYYEHIIRNENELNRIRQYIIHNPANWYNDINFD